MRVGEDLMAGEPPVSRFAGTLMDILDRVEYSRVSKDEIDNPVYRLRYEAYRREESVPFNDAGVVVDDLDDAPNCMAFGVYIDGKLVSSLRVHHLSARAPHVAEHEGLPRRAGAAARPRRDVHRSKPVHRRLRGLARLSGAAVPDAAHRRHGVGPLRCLLLPGAGAARAHRLLSPRLRLGGDVPSPGAIRA